MTAIVGEFLVTKVVGEFADGEVVVVSSDTTVTAGGTVEHPAVALGPETMIHASTVLVTPADTVELADRYDTGDLQAGRVIGLGGLVGVGSNRKGTTTADGAAVAPGGLWDGLRLVGPMTSSVGAVWPTSSMDVRWRGRLLPITRDPDAEWLEVGLATIDEAIDYLEPAFVLRSFGVVLGFDFRIDGDTSSEEHTVLLTDALADPHGDHDYRFTIDGDAGTWAVYVDSVLFATGDTADEELHPATSPFTFDAPPEGHPLWIARASIALEHFEIRDEIDGTIIHHFDVADAEDGDTSVTSSETGEVWTTQGGVVLSAWDAPKIIHGNGGGQITDAEDTQIGADESFTWAIDWTIWGSIANPGTTWWVQDIVGMLFGGQPGWGLARSSLFGVGFGWLVGDGVNPHVQADLGSVPAGRHVLAAVLDRDTETLTLYVSVDGEIVDSASASITGLGAIDSTVDSRLLTTNGYAAVEWSALWRSALSVTDIAALSGPAPAGPGVDLEREALAGLLATVDTIGTGGATLSDADPADVGSAPSAGVSEEAARADHVHDIGSIVADAVAALVDAAPSTLDTLNELAAALGDDASFASTVTTALAGKQPLDADLTAIAALTTTPFGRARLTDADGSTARLALGVTRAGPPLTYPANSYILLSTEMGTGYVATSLGSSATDSSNRVIYTPFTMPTLGTGLGLGALALQVVAGNAGGSAVLRMGVHADDGAGSPGTLVKDAGSVSINTNGLKELSFTGVDMSAYFGKRMWLAVVFQGLDTAGANPTCSSVVSGTTGVPETAPAASSSMFGNWTATGVSGALASSPSVSIVRGSVPKGPNVWAKVVTL